MENIVELIPGQGITMTANSENKTVTISATGDFLTADQKAALNNPTANAGNKFITMSEAQDKITGITGPITPGPNQAPPGFPKLIVASGNFVIPQNGRYLIKIAGGGGGGAGTRNGGNYNGAENGLPGGNTIVMMNNSVYIGNGGNGASYRLHAAGGTNSVKYDGIKGAANGGYGGTGDLRTSSGYPASNGEDAAGAGGIAGTLTFSGTTAACSGGGAGGVIAGDIEASHGTNGINNTYPSNANDIHYGAKGGKGYGAGGGGGGGSISYNMAVGSLSPRGGGGGGSGNLKSMTLMLAQGTILKTIIGAGGAGGLGFSGYVADVPGRGGAGAQGAVLIEWVAGS